MKKNKKSIFIYFLEMLIVFILIDGVITVLPSVISNNITYYKYGTELLLEVIYAALVLIVMILFKNSYVFTAKKQKFVKSITLGFPMLIIAAISLLGSLTLVILLTYYYLQYLLVLLKNSYVEDGFKMNLLKDMEILKNI